MGKYIVALVATLAVSPSFAQSKPTVEELLDRVSAYLTRAYKNGQPVTADLIWVDFRMDEKLGLLVPYEMKEDFFAGRFREGAGTARYSNYRQFKTAARIVPPPQP